MRSSYVSWNRVGPPPKRRKHPSMSHPCAVAITAGGASRRMGTDKARLLVAGEPLIARLDTALCAIGPVMIIGGDSTLLAILESGRSTAAHVGDLHPGEGPLGALLTALGVATEPSVALVACDLPDLDAAVVLQLLEEHVATGADVTVPLVGGHSQWHVSIWRRGVLGELEERFESGERSLRRATYGLRTTHVVIADGTKLADLDTPQDLANYEIQEPLRGSSPVGVYDRLVLIPETSVDELAALVASGAPVSIIDVREPHEYEAGHAPGAILIPLGDIVERTSELPTGPLHVICGSGVRSLHACEALAPLGFDVTNIAGGTGGWIAAGHEVESGTSAE